MDVKGLLAFLFVSALAVIWIVIKDDECDS